MSKLSQNIEQELQDRVREGGYASQDELVRDALLTLDERSTLEASLIAALESGEAIEVGPATWEAKKRALLERRASSDLSR